jgi:hypothetical protein
MTSSAFKSAVGAGVLAACAALASPGHAIVINDGYGDAASQTLGAPFTAVVSIGSNSCTGALIAPTVVLMAQHCATPGAITVQQGGSDTTYGVASRADANATTVTTDGSDISLLFLSNPVAGVTPLRLLDAAASTLLGDTALMVGFGLHGLGSNTTRTIDGIRRAAANVIDQIVSASLGTRIFTDFDDGTLPHNGILSGSMVPLTEEGTTDNGDSGGPLLIFDGDEWLIVGVARGGTSDDSVYGDVADWTAVFDWKDFIALNGGAFAVAGIDIPAPPSLGVFVLALLGMAAVRRRATRN